MSGTSVEECYKAGDIVWAKQGKNSKYWPAMVLDPEAVGAPDHGPKYITVYWFGYSRISQKVCSAD